MPKRAGQSSEPKVARKNASKAIKKEPKGRGRKAVVDQAVLGGKAAVHYILILDDSYSMEGRAWADLRNASDAFLQALVNSREADSCKVSCVIYNSDARIAFEGERPSLGLIDKIRFQGGGTAYAPAIGLAQSICGRAAENSEKFVFYFMSDGCPGDSPDGAVALLKRQNYFDKIEFNACGFGSSRFERLEQLAGLFPGGKITKAPTVAELKQSMLFILRAGNSGPRKDVERSAKGLKPLWNRDQLSVGDHFSSISYLKVQKIEGDTVTVENSLGGSWVISKDLLVRDAWSAELYAQEVKTTMTELARILSECQDTVFTVSFKRKVTADDLMATLATMDESKVSKAKDLEKLVTLGQDCQITGRLAGEETVFGRSLVVDLDADSGFKQVDHRTINWIIYKNVKYSLGKSAKKEGAPAKPAEGPRWDASRIQVGQWLSATSYYKVREITDKESVKVAETRDSQTDITMARDILETEMNSGLAFEKEEKVSRTDLVEKLIGAGESAFTIHFNKKVDAEHIKNVLSSAGAEPDLAQISKDVITGQEVQMTCHFTKTENQLGRSLVMDLNAPHGKNFRQIDHRTVNSLILKNVKYTVK